MVAVYAVGGGQIMSIPNQSATAREDAFDLAATGLEEAASKAAALFVSIGDAVAERELAEGWTTYSLPRGAAPSKPRYRWWL